MGFERNDAAMAGSYAVAWRSIEDRTYAGKLELRPNRLRLEGSSSGGDITIEEVFYDEISGVRIGRAEAERLSGRPMLVITRRARSPLSVASADSPGTLQELLERLALLIARSGAEHTRALVILPLKPNERSQAQAVLDEGPPFVPETTSFERHQVFLTDEEVVFLFEGRDVGTAVEKLLGNPSVWKRAASWEHLLAGPPRFAEVAYSWVHEEEASTP